MAESVVKRNIVKIDLDSGNIRRSWINHSIGLSDNLGDAFGVELYRAGVPVNLGGATIMGYFHDPWGNNIVINGGDITYNLAVIYLPQACYNHEGQFTLALKIITDRETSSMVIFDGMIDNTNTGSAVAPTGTVPTYQEVLAVYDQMLEAKAGSVRFDIVQSLTDAQKLQAQNNMGAYYQPQIDTVNGKIGNTALPTTAQTLTGAIAEHEGDLTNQQWQITDLKSALAFAPVDLLIKAGRNNITDAGITFTWNADKTACTVNGTVSGSIPAAQYFNGSTTAMPTGFKAGGTYHVTLKSTSNDAGIGVYYYKNNGTYFSGAQFRADTTFTIPSDATGMLVFVFVQNGKSVSNDVVSDFGVFECETNDQISERTEQLFNEAKKSLEDGSYLLHFKRKQLTNNQNKTYISSQFRLSTDTIYFDNKFLKILVDSGYKANVFFKDQSNTYLSRELSEGQHFFYAGSSVPVVFELYKNPLAIISTEDAKHITVTDVDTEETNDIGCGIKSHVVKWDKGSGISANYLYYYNETNRYVSCPIKIPKSGLRIGYNPKYHTKTYIYDGNFKYPAFKIMAVKKGNNGMTLQTTNEDLQAVSTSNTSERVSVYIPYVEDSYIIINMPIASAVSGVDYSDALWVTSGEVDRSFCGVYNIFPTALQIKTDMSGFTDYNSLDIFGAQSDWYSYSSMMYYATVLRLRDVRKIVCGPKYTIMAEIYKINTDGSVTRHSDIWGSWSSDSPTGQTSTSGVSVIDFDQYDFDGFALVAIQSTIVYKKDTASETGYSFRKLTTGNLGGYEDVIKSVCVDYKNGVSISKVPGMPSILEENIHRLMNWKIPEYGEGFYVEQASTVPHYFPTQYDCVPSMYAGTYVANSLLMQVTAKSALTCVKNRNGRMRKMQRIQASQGTPSKGDIAFGLTCTNFTSVIRGLKENYASVSWVLQDKLKFDTYDFDYKHEMNKLRPGDVLTKFIEDPVLGRNTNAHCMTVESIIEVNGVVKAVNIIEATIPYCRRATFIDEEYYMSNENWVVKMYTIDKLADYKWINRIKPEYLKPITQTFDMYPDNTDVGTVMCDRGTDSIYGIHTGYVELSFKDEDVTTNLYLYKNGTQIATIPKSGASTVNGLQLINVAGYLDGEGLYTVKTDKSNDVQETFYVKGDVAPIAYTEDEETTNLTIPNISDFIWMEVWNSIPVQPDETEEQTEHRLASRRCRTYTIEDMTVDETTNTGTISIPRYQYNFEGEQEDISSIDRVYETQYGTYWASISGRVSSDYYGLDS